MIQNTIAILSLATALAAQWPTNPTTNVPVGDGVGNQAVPRIAATSDGGCYIAWFDNRGGTYAVYLQRLDGHGTEQWTHGGILVSGNPQNSSLVGWDLIADREDHCVLAFTDTRSGPDLDVYAYRIAPNGAFDWGANGVALSNNTDAEANPTICEASDGDFVFFWPNSTARTIQMQRLDRLGAPRLPGDGIAQPGDSGASPAFVHAVAGDAGSAIAIWVRAIAQTAVKHLHMQKWDPAGTPLWNGGTRLPVFDLTSVPTVHEPRIRSDGGGGAVIAWHYATGQQFFARVQRVAASGLEVFPHNGVDLSTNGNSRFDPLIAFLPASQEILAVFNERNQAQSQWGITAQKIDSAGNRMFGAAGTTILPVSATERQAPSGAPTLDGLTAFVSEALPSPNTYKILGLRIDAAGSITGPVDVSTAASQKIRTVAAAGASGTAFAAWSDTRVDSGDIHAQNLNTDGSLGDKLATVTGYGCGSNPPGSLVTTGRAAIGTSMTLGVDNPLGTQSAGAFAVLAVAFAPTPGFPCGQLVPGYGMASPATPGEVLIDLSQVGLTLFSGPWNGPLQPVQFVLTTPPTPALYALQLYAQGVMLDLQPAAPIAIGVTGATHLIVGS
jgi:hypothetical protein